jgi:ABC-2 type transport system permease protein
VADTLLAPAPGEPPGEAGTGPVTIPTPVVGNTGALHLIAGQTLAALRQAWRTPIGTFFTLIVPVVFLVLISAITGNAVVDARGGIRIAQFTTPALMAFAVAMATFSVPTVDLVTARDAGVLKRLRGTPLPAWAYLAGRVLSASLVAVTSVAIMLAVAVVAFDVQVLAGGLLPGAVTLLVGIVTFLMLAFGLAAVAPSPAAAQGVSTGAIILLGFVSEVFLVAAETPRWLTAIGDVFPLKHLVNGLQDAFDPYLVGSAWSWQHLAVMGAWALAGALVALWRFGWEPRTRTAGAAPGAGGEVGGAVPAARSAPGGALDGDLPVPAVRTHHPTMLTTMRDQVAYANRASWRDRSSLVFAALMPVGLVLLLPAVFGSGEMPWRAGMRFPQFYAPAMAVYGIAVHAFVNVPESLAIARDRGVLKRLRGTPLPAAVFLAGRWASIVVAGALITVAAVGVGVVAYEVAVPAGRLPALVVTFLVGTTSLAVLGLLVASVVPNAASVPAIALGVLLPLSFVSDIFMLGDLPPVVSFIGWLFPLKHFVHAMVDAIDPATTGAGWSWDHLAVLVAWGMAGAIAAALTFRWSPRVSSGRAAGAPEEVTTP